jgi:hypothetical protein
VLFLFGQDVLHQETRWFQRPGRDGCNCPVVILLPLGGALAFANEYLPTPQPPFTAIPPPRWLCLPPSRSAEPAGGEPPRSSEGEIRAGISGKFPAEETEPAITISDRAKFLPALMIR